MSLVLRGRCWKLGDDVTSEQILPTRSAHVKEPAELRRLCLAEVVPGLAERVRPEDIIVAGRNFGKGNPHQTAIAIRALASGLVAESISRGFYRVGVYRGLPMLFCPGVGALVEDGHELEVDFPAGTVRNLTTGGLLQGEPVTGLLLDVLEAGGSLAMIQRRLQLQAAEA